MDLQAAQVIRFSNATEGHKYLVDAILKPDQGLTFDVFRDIEVAPVEPTGEEVPPVEEESAALQKVAKEPSEILPRTIFVKEVVREPRMHFYKVPRLGSYLAIRLEYQSCLYEESFDAAVIDYLDVQQRQSDQDFEKKSFIEKMQ